MKRLAIIVPIMFLLVACGSTQTVEQRAYQVLYTSKAMYNLTMESVRDLQDQGLINPEERAEINEKANDYYEAHVTASQAYLKARLINDYSAMPDHIKAVEVALTLLLEVARPFLLKGGM
jgi:hypothetical protein